MSEKFSTEDMERLDDMKERCLMLLTENKQGGNEILSIYVFLQYILLEFQGKNGNNQKISYHDANFDYEAEKEYILSRCDECINQRKEQAHAKIEEKRKEKDKNSSDRDEKFKKRLEKTNRERNAGLLRLEREREELLEMFHNVNEPDRQRFFLIPRGRNIATNTKNAEIYLRPCKKNLT